MSSLETHFVAQVIAKLKKFYGLDNDQDLANLLEVSHGAIYQWRTRNSLKIIEKILLHCPEVDFNWLLRTEYELPAGLNYDSEVGEPQPHFRIYKPHQSVEGEDLVYVLDLRAAAGYPQHYQDKSYFEDLPTISLPFPDLKGRSHLAIQIDGSSMEETIQHSDYVICHQVSDLADMIRGHIYAVVHPEGIICKRLGALDGDRIVFESDNPAYGAERLHGRDVLQVWRVRYKISNNLRRIEPVASLREALSRIDKLSGQLDHVDEFLEALFAERHKKGPT